MRRGVDTATMFATLDAEPANPEIARAAGGQLVVCLVAQNSD
jgi:hypothetical protein